MKELRFFHEVALLVSVLPFVSKERCFALKGGTAINLFIRNMPRLSVDIDLTYLPIEDREQSLNGIQNALLRIKSEILRVLPNIKVMDVTPKGMGSISGLIVASRATQIKVEVNLVIRGVVYQPLLRELCTKAQQELGAELSMLCSSTADIYGVKICAALDRQHPRDLFDVKNLFENEGITTEVRKAFIVYLLSHDRPIHELLVPNYKDISTVYADDFQGMTKTVVSLDDLLATRSQLVSTIRASLTSSEKELLLSFKKGNPQWELLDLVGVEHLPAIKWKQLNIKKMDSKKWKQQIERLEQLLKA